MEDKLKKLFKALNSMGYYKEGRMVEGLVKLSTPIDDIYIYPGTDSGGADKPKPIVLKPPTQRDFGDVDDQVPPQNVESVESVDNEENIVANELLNITSSLRELFQGIETPFDIHVVPPNLQLRNRYFLPSGWGPMSQSIGLNNMMNKILTNASYYLKKTLKPIEALSFYLDGHLDPIRPNISSSYNEEDLIEFNNKLKIFYSSLNEILSPNDNIDLNLIESSIPKIYSELEKLNAIFKKIKSIYEGSDLIDFQQLNKEYDLLTQNFPDSMEILTKSLGLVKWITESVTMKPNKCIIIWGLVSGQSKPIKGEVGFDISVGAGWSLHDIFHGIERVRKNISLSSALENLDKKLSSHKPYLDRIQSLTPGVSGDDRYATLFALMSAKPEDFNSSIEGFEDFYLDRAKLKADIEAVKAGILESLRNLRGNIIFLP